MTPRAALFAAAPALLAAPALADAGHAHAPDIGEAAHPAEASRTVEVVMRDTVFAPEEIEVAPGETVRFVVRNEGGLVHEFNLGTQATHAAHREEMREMMERGALMPTEVDRDSPHGEHDHANSLLLEPGETGSLTWSFPRGGALEFACNVPGHYSAGMVGEIEVEPEAG